MEESTRWRLNVGQSSVAFAGDGFVSTHVLIACTLLIRLGQGAFPETPERWRGEFLFTGDVSRLELEKLQELGVAVHRVHEGQDELLTARPDR